MTARGIVDEEAVELLERGDLHTLGEAAHAVRRKLHPEPVVTYIIDRNVNYTNVCVTRCAFCAFSRPEGHLEAYILPREELAAKISETIRLGGVQILLQGGHHPRLGIEWYEDLLRWIKASFKVHLHAFSPAEIVHIARVSGIAVDEALDRLRAAGLDTIPGGGAELLVDDVRAKVSPRKATADEWMDVMRRAHRKGIRSSATMVYGLGERHADRVAHLRRLRELQDETGGFTSFIAWPMQTANTGLAHLPTTGGYEYLRTLAVARLYLHNIPNVQASWVTQGEKVGQLALLYGANDMGSTMIEENVVAQAGTRHRLSEARIRELIADLGFAPRRRNTYYEVIEAAQAAPE